MRFSRLNSHEPVCTSDDSSSSLPVSAPTASLLAFVPEPPRDRSRREAHRRPDPGRPRDGQPVRLVQLRARGPHAPTDEPLAVVGNGSHVDPIAELELGYPARDALATPLLALDFEKDDYDTPGSPAWSAPRPRRSGSSAATASSSRPSTSPPSSPPTRTDSPEPYALAAADAETPDAAAARQRSSAPTSSTRCARAGDRRRRRRNAGVRQRRGVANRPRRLRWGAALDPSGDPHRADHPLLRRLPEHHDAPRALDLRRGGGLSAGKEEDEE